MCINMAFGHLIYRLRLLSRAAVDCRVLLPPANGFVVVGTTTLGSMATYSCDPSFRIVGTDSRECQEDGTWSGETPTCEGD